MTDDEKLAFLNVIENDGWILFEHAETSDAGIHAMDIIERCQRIRAYLVGFKVSDSYGTLSRITEEEALRWPED